MFNGPDVLVIDNAPIHSGLKEIVQEPEFMGNHIFKLRPYSPMLNPIESAWSAFKVEVKCLLAQKIMDILRGVGQGNLPCTEFRLRILEGVIIISIPVITPNLCNNVIAKIQSLILSVLNMEYMTY